MTRYIDVNEVAMNPYIEQAIKEAESKLAKWSKKRPCSIPLEAVIADYCTALVWEALDDELKRKFGTNDMQIAILQEDFAEWLLNQDLYIGSAAFCKASSYRAAEELLPLFQLKFRFFDTIFFEAMWAGKLSNL